MTDDRERVAGCVLTCRGSWGKIGFAQPPSGDVDQYTCEECGALTAVPEKHRDWHVAQELGR